MEEAHYVGVLAKSMGWDEEFIRWELPLARGWAYYHTARLLDGEAMRWPDKRLRAGGRWWQRVRAKILGS